MQAVIDYTSYHASVTLTGLQLHKVHCVAQSQQFTLVACAALPPLSRMRFTEKVPALGRQKPRELRPNNNGRHNATNVICHRYVVLAVYNKANVLIACFKIDVYSAIIVP